MSPKLRVRPFPLARLTEALASLQQRLEPIKKKIAYRPSSNLGEAPSRNDLRSHFPPLSSPTPDTLVKWSI